MLLVEALNNILLGVQPDVFFNFSGGQGAVSLSQLHAHSHCHDNVTGPLRVTGKICCMGQSLVCSVEEKENVLAKLCVSSSSSFPH